MGRVVATTHLPGDPARLLDGHEWCGPVAGEAPWPRTRWLVELATADALVCLLSDRIDAAALDAGPRLRVVANYAVGVDNVDVAAATARGVLVANTPDVLVEATADFTFALMLAAARRLGEGERMVRAGAWRGWAPEQLLGADVGGRTLGIVGMGRIGRAVARRARGFAMRVLYTRGHAGDGAEAWATRVELDELLATSDVVSLHCPLTPETRGLVDARALAAMKPGAILVNTARGAIVDDGALAEALERGHLGGAGLDVFTEEPRIDPRLLAAPRVVLAPHLGSATTTARTRMAELCVTAVRDVLAGRRPTNLVNHP
ncbi:MAG TPA: D-glycerate dehydrogenase [Kofleriaceae bacterium]|nr:D-glycerate dehydrogenase [Kofleriaceae bacterium]